MIHYSANDPCGGHRVRHFDAVWLTWCVRHFETLMPWPCRVADG